MQHYDINILFETATVFVHYYQSMIKTHTLDDLKGSLAPLNFDSNPKWIEVGVPIYKKDLNIKAWN